MLRCIAVDDEPLALELLEDNISKVPFLQLVAKCSNAMEAMKVLQQESVDLIFLDIQMPGLTGLQFIQSMANKPMIILITAYEKYALQGFNLDVTDYLVKPVSLDRFVKACNKAWELHQLKNKPAINNSTSAPAPDYFFVNVDYSLLKINFADIIWIEGLKDYVRIHLKSTSKSVITRISMKSIEDQLPSAKFLRIHKSYIVSIENITAIRKNSIFLIFFLFRLNLENWYPVCLYICSILILIEYFHN
jgi:two-component system LytT family response regulator